MPVLSADVDVELDVVDRNNKPPVWDANVYGPIHIKENVTVGTVVTSVKARFVCHDMTETRHVTCRAVPCSAAFPIYLLTSLFDFTFLCFSSSDRSFTRVSRLFFRYTDSFLSVSTTFSPSPHSFLPFNLCLPSFFKFYFILSLSLFPILTIYSPFCVDLFLVYLYVYFSLSLDTETLDTHHFLSFSGYGSTYG